VTAEYRHPKRRVKKPSARRIKKPSAPSGEKQTGERLQKVLAASGAGSRRACEDLIVSGRVEVDQRVVTELGTRVDPATQDIRLDGQPLAISKHVYFAVHKPRGVLSTNRDPSGRPRVVDLVAAGTARLFTIGRLDLNSEGLILVTNDGELANRLTHPRYGVSKTYRVLVAGNPSTDILDKLKRGIHLAEGFVRVENISVRSRQKESALLEMVLREGRNREIRRLLARVGHKVLRLTRIAVGPVRLGTLPAGANRRLTHKEIESLRREANAAGGR
jgi:23S rRNA pseudouridine2605 synthase